MRELGLVVDGTQREVCMQVVLKGRSKHKELCLLSLAADEAAYALRGGLDTAHHRSLVAEAQSLELNLMACRCEPWCRGASTCDALCRRASCEAYSAGPALCTAGHKPNRSSRNSAGTSAEPDTGYAWRDITAG